jgi:hypothetical protein
MLKKLLFAGNRELKIAFELLKRLMLFFGETTYKTGGIYVKHLDNFMSAKKASKKIDGANPEENILKEKSYENGKLESKKKNVVETNVIDNKEISAYSVTDNKEEYSSIRNRDVKKLSKENTGVTEKTNKARLDRSCRQGAMS